MVGNLGNVAPLKLGKKSLATRFAEEAKVVRLQAECPRHVRRFSVSKQEGRQMINKCNVTSAFCQTPVVGTQTLVIVLLVGFNGVITWKHQPRQRIVHLSSLHKHVDQWCHRHNFDTEFQLLLHLDLVFDSLPLVRRILPLGKIWP